MAYMEITLLLVAMLSSFDLEFEDPRSEAKKGFRAADAFVVLRPQVRVRITPREEHSGVDPEAEDS